MSSKGRKSGNADASRVLTHKEKPAGGGATGTPANSPPARAERDAGTPDAGADATPSPTSSQEKEKRSGDVLDDILSDGDEPQASSGVEKERQRRRAQDKEMAKSGRAGSGPPLTPRLESDDFGSLPAGLVYKEREGEWLKLLELILANKELALACTTCGDVVSHEDVGTMSAGAHEYCSGFFTTRECKPARFESLVAIPRDRWALFTTVAMRLWKCLPIGDRPKDGRFLSDLWAEVPAYPSGYDVAKWSKEKEISISKMRKENEAREEKERSKRSTQDQLQRWKDMEVYDAATRHPIRQRREADEERGRDRGTGQKRPLLVTATEGRRVDQEEGDKRDRVFVQRRGDPGPDGAGGIRMHIRGNGGLRVEEKDPLKRAVALVDVLDAVRAWVTAAVGLNDKGRRDAMRDIVSRFLREDMSENSPLQGGETVRRWDSVYHAIMVREGKLAGQVDAVATEPSQAPTKSTQQLAMIKADLEALCKSAEREMTWIKEKESGRHPAREADNGELAADGDGERNVLITRQEDIKYISGGSLEQEGHPLVEGLPHGSTVGMKNRQGFWIVVRGWKYGIKISEKRGTIAPGVALRLRVPLEASGNGGVVAHLSRYFHNFTVQPRAAMRTALEEAKLPMMSILMEGRGRSVIAMQTVLEELWEYSCNTFTKEEMYTSGIEQILGKLTRMARQGATCTVIENLWDIVISLITTEWKTHVYAVGGLDEPTSTLQVERMIDLEENVLSCPFKLWCAAQLSMETNHATRSTLGNVTDGKRGGGDKDGDDGDKPARPWSPRAWGKGRGGHGGGRRDHRDKDLDRDRGREESKFGRSRRSRSRSRSPPRSPRHRSSERDRSRGRERDEKYRRPKTEPRGAPRDSGSGRKDSGGGSDRHKLDPKGDKPKGSGGRGSTGNEGAVARTDAEGFQKTWCKFYWFTPGGCKDGSKCTFSHDEKDKPAFNK
jgi:hypothetical protein